MNIPDCPRTGIAKYGTAILLFLLLVLSSSRLYAGFQEGLFAIHKGEYLTAFREFRSLAENGDAKAQVQLGIMYEMGLGIKQDYEEASRWYQKAAVQGDPDGQKRLLDMRKKGLNPTFRPSIPENWQGNSTDPQSQYDIGVMYSKGLGVKKDYSIAYRWFYLSANQGHVRAQNEIAYLLSRGLGVQQNKREAYAWFLKAAKQGFAEAQHNLGVMLTLGTSDGLPQHYTIAYMWFEIAAQNGILESRNSQVKLAKKLTEKQIKEAKTLARRWLAKNRIEK